MFSTIFSQFFNLFKSNSNKIKYLEDFKKCPEDIYDFLQFKIKEKYIVNHILSMIKYTYSDEHEEYLEWRKQVFN
jgi:hypothetical protein